MQAAKGKWDKLSGVFSDISAFSVWKRSGMEALFKGFAEITAIAKSQAESDLGNGELGIPQIESGFFQSVN